MYSDLSSSSEYVGYYVIQTGDTIFMGNNE